MSKSDHAEAEAVTVRVSVVVLGGLPEGPGMGKGLVPVVAEPLAVRVRVLVPAVLAGLNAAVTPAGMPEAERSTRPAKPFWAATLMLVVALAPCAILTVLGAAVSAKLGAGRMIDTLSK